MKKGMALLLLLVLTCVCNAALAETELVVFAAASLTETMTEIAAKYEAENEGVRIICNFDSSGTLKTQIGEGAECDLFISAGQKQMNQLEEAEGFIQPGSRIDLLENHVVLTVSETGAEKEISSFDALAELLRNGDVLLCMGNSDVPVGQYTQRILAWYGLDEDALAEAGKVTYGTNVKEVTSQVALSSVDCGVVYATDACSAGLTVMDQATAEMCGQVIYPAAVILNGTHADEASDFLNYLAGEEAMSVFESIGFAPVNP